MDPLLATLRALPLLAVTPPGDGDRTRLILYLVSFTTLAGCAVSFLWLIFGPCKPKSDPPQDNRPENGSAALTIILLAAALALFVIFLLQISNASHGGFGAP